MERFFDVVTDRRGNAISGASVTIKTEAGATATIFSDDGVTTATNPLTTNADGEYTFFAANGKYSTNVSASGYSTEIVTERVLFDPADLRVSVNEVTTVAYTLSASDIADWIMVNTSATAVLSITTASGYAVGDSTIIRQKGAGQVVLSAGSGVTLNTADTSKTRAQHSVIAITQDETAKFSVYGDLATS